MSSFHATPTRLAVLGGAVLLTGTLAAPARAEQYTKSYAVSARPSVEVNADNGGVHIVTSDTPEVRFHVTYEVDGRNPPHIDSGQHGNTVQLSAHFEREFFGFGKRWMKIEVDMPRSADLQIATSNGGVDVTSLDGNVVVHTSNGSIQLAQLSGTVEIGTSNGGIRVSSVKGDLKARTSNGGVGIDNLDGNCDVATSNGSVNVSGRLGRLDVGSSNGRVTVRAESGSRMASGWSIHTGNAAVTVAVPSDFKADLDATTSNGKIVLNVPAEVHGDLSRWHIHGALNGGGPSLFIHTSNGPIHLDPI